MNALRAAARLRPALRTQTRLASSTPVEWKEREVDPQLNGYPQLPAVSYQRRQPYGWDDMQERRNHGEPVSNL